MIIGEGTYHKRIIISECKVGVYLRWWYNGWHYFNFTNGYVITMTTESMGSQVTNMFSRISKIERDTKIKSGYAYQITLEGITAGNIPAFTGLLLAEKVEQYEGIILPSATIMTYSWREIEVTRGAHIIREDNAPGYILNFEITRDERPGTSSVFQKALKLYLDDTLCDMDDDEVVPVNKQTNDIAEMQDRQADFTAQFKIRKTRTMQLLFERSGDVGANTDFPYKNQVCRLVQDGIEMITGGKMILDKVDDLYYYVSIYSGNLSFFKSIENLKLTDITLPGSPGFLEHTWNIATQKILHDAVSAPDYIYPLMEPSDDAAMNPLRLAGNTTELYGGWTWPFVKAKIFWDAIFTDAGFDCQGDILTNDIFLNLYLPITSLTVTRALLERYLYSGFRRGFMVLGIKGIFGLGGTGRLNLILGDTNFADGHYICRFTGSYKITVKITFAAGVPDIWLDVNLAGTGAVGPFTLTSSDATHATYEYTYAATAGDDLAVWGDANTYFDIEIAYIDITTDAIKYGDLIDPIINMPDIKQVEFIKTICNMFGLIPEVIPRDRVIKFWNFSELYDNVGDARDWSKYLSERDDETEFKFGDYAQRNNLKYKDSDDVIKDNGRGTMLVEDETLQAEKDLLTLNISTCDDIYIGYTAPTVPVSRISMNKWYDDAGIYKAEKTIDARIVYVKRATGKTLKLWDDAAMAGGSVTVTDPRIASSLEVSFSYLVTNYAWLSRMLTKTNLRRAKFNLPVYEVAGMKHYIPIYLSQYKAYFYVNKINNYVPGQLCTIDLIKL